MGASNIDHVGDWLRTHSGEFDTRGAMRDACADATGSTPKYTQGRISAMMRREELPWIPPDMSRAPGERVHALAPDPAPARPLDMPAAGPTAALSETALRAEIDVHFKARAFLENIPKGDFYPLEDAAIAAGIPRSQARQVFGDTRYTTYRGQAISNNRTYVGHPERIAAMKQERIMR